MRKVIIRRCLDVATPTERAPTARRALDKENAMSFSDKVKHKAEELKGKGKEAIGRAAGDDELVVEGKTDQAKGRIKQAGEKIKDIFK
jgi:uncharacterized protein YjbJ (UPF0337 family)